MLVGAGFSLPHVPRGPLSAHWYELRGTRASVSSPRHKTDGFRLWKQGMSIYQEADLSATPLDADEMQARRAVTACFFGDGAVAEGEFHECMNLASLWRLPVLFLCENNLYAMGTAYERHQAQLDLTLKAKGYAVPAESADGMDVLAVRETVSRAVDRARREKMPTLIESRTYRFRGHSMRDPAAAVYRTREEVDEWKKSDPIVLLWDRMSRDGVISDSEYKDMDKEITQVVEEAARFADASPPPPLEELLTDVYV